jgi:REP element-mobilizing transposase RayT
MHDYPGRLSHVVPSWVSHGSTFHVRIRADTAKSLPLNNPVVGSALLNAAVRHHATGRWYCRLFLVMPDHLHALLAFPPDKRMSDVIGAWKGFQAIRHGITWQANYFDHRIRNEKALEEKAGYIRRNPVVKNLCASEDDWPWVISCLL